MEQIWRPTSQRTDGPPQSKHGAGKDSCGTQCPPEQRRTLQKLHASVQPTVHVVPSPEQAAFAVADAHAAPPPAPVTTIPPAPVLPPVPAALPPVPPASALVPPVEQAPPRTNARPAKRQSPNEIGRVMTSDRSNERAVARRCGPRAGRARRRPALPDIGVAPCLKILTAIG